MSARKQIPPRPAVQARCLSRCGAIFLGVLVSCAIAVAQNANAPEVTTQERQPEFKIQVERNMVLVRVVVRDTKGRLVGGLTKEDFRLFDDGKPQVITQFAIESSVSQREKKAASTPAKEEVESLSEEAASPAMPRNYLGLYFDDTLMTFEDLARTRDAAEHYLASALQPDDRIGIFTSSGQGMVDFTDDRAKLDQALSLLRPRPINDIPQTCPDIHDYQAYLMVYRHDPFATDIANEEAFTCTCAGLPTVAQAGCEQQIQSRVDAQALEVLNRSESQIQYSLRGLEGLVRRMTILPGRHNIIFVSPGFLSHTVRQRIGQISERALRANVVINSFDCKGLYVGIPFADASQPNQIVSPRKPYILGQKAQMLIDGMNHAQEVLGNLAFDTGGEFFHNSNDLDKGFRQLGTLADISYMLAFSPQNLKTDGRFHNLKVSLVKSTGLTVQARRGYFAPNKSENASTQATEDIKQVLFSQEEMNELAVEVHTQFFKLNDTDARLSVLIRLDPRALHFRKEQGRNLENVTFVTAIFDRDGKYVTGREKRLDFHLRDTSLDKLEEAGINLKTSFSMKPGTYTVRQVVRDAEGGQISGVNRVVEIPY